MIKNKRPLMIPFSYSNEEMLNYVWKPYDENENPADTGVIWKENYEFEDTLYFECYSRGRSSATFELVSKTDNKSYNVFMKDMLNIVQNGIINKGVIKGRWTFVKRGKNYGIRLLGENE